MGIDVTRDEKQRFVKEWLTSANPYEAALKAFADRDTGFATMCGANLPHDEETLAIRADMLKEKGEQAFLPDKVEMARKILRIIDEKEGDVPLHTATARLRGVQLYCQLLGLLPKDDYGAGGSTIDTAALAEMLPG